jgi:hypothetical protein
MLALLAHGPGVTNVMPGRPVSFPYASARCFRAGRRSAGSDFAHRTTRVEDRKTTFTWDAKRALGAVGDQRVDEPPVITRRLGSEQFGQIRGELRDGLLRDAFDHAAAKRSDDAADLRVGV